jgi:hypothetical protein
MITRTIAVVALSLTAFTWSWVAHWHAGALVWLAAAIAAIWLVPRD